MEGPAPLTLKSSSMAVLPSLTDDSRLASRLPVLRPNLPRGGAYRDLEGRGVATFCLTAPFKRTAHLIGDFNHWNPHATPMLTDGSGFFWATVRNPFFHHAPELARPVP